MKRYVKSDSNSSNYKERDVQESIQNLLVKLGNKYGFDLNLSSFFRWNTNGAYVGVSMVKPESEWLDYTVIPYTYSSRTISSSDFNELKSDIIKWVERIASQTDKANKLHNDVIYNQKLLSEIQQQLRLYLTDEYEDIIASPIRVITNSKVIVNVDVGYLNSTPYVGNEIEIYVDLPISGEVSNRIYVTGRLSKSQLSEIQKTVVESVEEDVNLKLRKLNESNDPTSSNNNKKKSRKLSYKQFKQKLQDAIDSDMYEEAEEIAFNYLGDIENSVYDALHIEIEQNTKLSEGTLTFYDNNEQWKPFDIDYEDFQDHEIDMALSSNSIQEFKKKFKSYVQNML